MDIIIRDRNTGMVFDIPPGFVLENKNTSPFFNELGSKTNSGTLPMTRNNKKILEHANLISMQKASRTKFPVIISQGSYMRDGMFYLSKSENSSHTFSFTIAYNEAIMYESMGDILLTDITDLPLISYADVDTALTAMNTLLTADNLSADLSVFPVCLKEQKYSEQDENNESKDKYNYIYLNEVDTEKKELIRKSTIKAVVSSELKTIPVPAGFGITPFIKVWKVLELCFAHFGYTISTNPFRTAFQLNRLCLLNNNLDSVVFSEINYRQLLPDVSISDFLKALYCRFGMKVFFDSATNSIDLRLLKDTFAQQEPEHISLNSEIDIEHTAARQVKLSVAKSLDRSNVEAETYEEFLIKYNNTVQIAATVDSLNGIRLDASSTNFVQSGVKGDIHIDKLLCSSLFDWNKKATGIEVEEISSVDEGITMMPLGIAPYYGIDGRLINTNYLIDGSEQETFNGDTKLVFVYDMGELYELSGAEKQYLGYKHGSIQPYVPEKLEVGQYVYKEDPDGNRFLYSLLLIGVDGAFNRFFKDYDAFLRHANNTATFEHVSPLYPLSTMKYYRPWLVAHQPVLADKVDYDLGGERMTKTTVQARTMRLLTPFNLDVEQKLPVPDPIAYQWQLYNGRDDKIEEKRQYEEDEYKKLNSDNYQFISYTLLNIDADDNPPESNTHWFLPPTQAQYERGVQAGSSLHDCTVTFKYEYRIRSESGQWGVVTEHPQKEITYPAHFNPVKL